MTPPISPLPPDGTAIGGGVGGGQATFSCVRSVYTLRYACLRRDWNSIKAELAWAQKNGATVTAQLIEENVRLDVALGNSNATDTITNLDPRDAAQIIESLRECGATIQEITQP